jgi:hypothetical protein
MVLQGRTTDGDVGAQEPRALCGTALVGCYKLLLGCGTPLHKVAACCQQGPGTGHCSCPLGTRAGSVIWTSQQSTPTDHNNNSSRARAAAGIQAPSPEQERVVHRQRQLDVAKVAGALVVLEVAGGAAAEDGRGWEGTHNRHQ